MNDDLASANVNRAYTLAGMSIAIFTFMLIFLFPRYVSGDVNPLLFQATLIVMGAATFSFVFASFYYYGSSLTDRIDDAERARASRRPIAYGCSDPACCSSIRVASARRR